MQVVVEIQSFVQSPGRMGELIGLIGAFVYIGGFFLLQTGRICGNSAVYSLSKVLAACLVLISLITAFNLAAFVIQIAYAAIGTYGAIRRLAPRRTASFATKNARKSNDLRARMMARRLHSAVSVLA